MYVYIYVYIYVCKHIHTVAVFSWNEHYRGSKTTNCILSNTNYDYRGRLIKTFLQFLAKYYIMASEHFYHGAWFLNQEILIVASHIQLHIYDFSNMVNLLGSSPGTALHLWCGAAINTMKGSRSEGISLAVILSGSIARYAVLPHTHIYIYIPMKPKLICVETGSEVNRREWQNNSPHNKT